MARARPPALAPGLLTLALAVLALALAVLALAPAGARAAWSRPFYLVAPGSLDYTPSQLALSSSGAAAAGLAIGDVDVPGSGQAYVVTRAPSGSAGAPQALAGARQVLALTYSGSTLDVLTGASPTGLDCCSSAAAVRITARGQQRPAQTVVGGLAGPALGALVALGGGHTLAAVATERGVWTSQGGPSGHFGRQHRLTGRAQAAEALSATWLGGRDSLVAWTAATGPAGFADPRAIFYSEGTRRSGPRRAHTLLRIRAGHRLDELVVGRRRRQATATWTESWFDPRGNFHSLIRTADFASHPRVHALSSPRAQASGLAMAADAAGGQTVAFKVCRPNGSCTLHVVTRARKGDFAHGRALGAIDAFQNPAVTVGPRGQVLVGWVRFGRPVVMAGTVGAARWRAPHVLSSTRYAYDLTLAFGRRGALAAWTQGTLNPSLVGAAYR